MGPAHIKNPRDLQARERLQEAQQAEAHAVADVYRAEAELAKTQTKHDATVAAAAAAADRAKADVVRVRAALVGVSGRLRAAQLLGLKPADLPRPSTGTNTKRDG